MKEKKLGRKILTVFMCCFILMAYMPLWQDAAEATSSIRGSFSEGDILKSATGKSFRFTGRDAGWMQVYYVSYATNGFKIGPSVERSPIKAYRVNGDVAYCIEHGVDTSTTAKLNANVLGDSALERIYNSSESTKHILINMSLCLLYGRQEDSKMSTLYNELGFRSSSYYKKTASSYNLDDWEAATRQLIHETQQRFRDEKFNKLSSNGLCYADGYSQGGTSSGGNGIKISQNHYRQPLYGTGAMDIYNYMAKLIKDHLQLSMRMGSNDETKPLELALEQGEDGKWYSAKIPVTKKQAVEMKLVKSDGTAYEKTYRLELLNEGEKYYYQYVMEKLPTEGKTYTVKKKIDYFKQVPDDMLIWECKDGSGNHVQALATGSCDPIERYVTFTTQKKIPGPRPTPEYFPQIQISVDKEDLNPGFDGDTHTPMGDAELSATYVLLRDGVEVDRVTLDEYGSTEVLSDMPWTSIDDFTVTESGRTATHIIPGDPPSSHGCEESPTRVDYDASVTYSVREIRPDGRFVEPDSGIRSMTVRYNGYTKDTRAYGCEAESWADIIYTVKTTSEDGISFTNQNGTIAAVDDQIAAEADTFVNDCYRGKLTLSKSLESSDVFSERKSGLSGGEKDSVNSKWKLSLNSGGFEESPYVRFVKEADLMDGTAVYRVVRDTSGASNETEDMIIGSNGDLLIYDIPYGEYTMSEVAADDASYVLENFQVRIDEHDKVYSVTEENDDRYDYNVRDKKKTNVIKLEKTNAETGKKVRAAGTKFYIRYMGDPLLDDPSSAKNYGRLLPNAEDITKDGPYTFEADENGEITIPYELEWGIYRIEEWLLPTGYFAGEYKEKAADDSKLSAKSHDYGTVEEGQKKALVGHEYSDVTGIYDESKSRAEYKEKDSYKPAEVFNYYTFKVEKQAAHSDGNFAQKVSSNKNISAADGTYDSADYPYVSYYKAATMPNNMTKGKIEINKSGEALSGFKKETKSGKSVYTPIYESTDKLKGAVFGIYAAEDILLNDGGTGARAYDSKTGEQVIIPLAESTHASSPEKAVKGELSKFFVGSGSTYETGQTEVSGGKLWFLNDRSETESGHNKTVYVTPEQRDTTYSYSYQKNEGDFVISYDVKVKMNYQAGGRSITDIEITKTTTAKDGYSIELPMTLPIGSVGERVLDPIENYLGEKDEIAGEKLSSFTVSDKTYTFEAAGKTDTDKDGNSVDLSAIGVSRYIKSAASTEGGEEAAYTLPEGYSLVSFAGDIDEDAQYVIASKTDEEGKTSYKVLLSDGLTWQDCDESGNFKKKLVQSYSASYIEEAGDDTGFTFSWDGFGITASVDNAKDEAAATITKQHSSIAAVIELGAGYEHKAQAADDSFTASKAEAPVYFMTADGIRIEAVYQGGVMKAGLDIPQSAVDKDFETVVPTLMFSDSGEDSIIDWYSELSPDKPIAEGSPLEGIEWQAERIESGKTGEAESYRIEFTSSLTEENPFKIKFSDGYTMSLYAGIAESGNGVGVIELEGVHKTNRASKSALVDSVTTDADGKAVSKLLPLGKYIVRELSAPSGYVTAGKEYEAELSYENQFVPLVWEAVSTENEYMSAQIELSKVFETAYESGTYAANGGAVFGLYTAQKLSAAAASAKEGYITSVDADTLIDVIYVDANGKARVDIKLPYGRYYIKEISTLSTHKKDEKPYYFEVGESPDDVSEPCEFDYEDDGISGNIALDGYGQAIVSVKTEVRYPMPTMKIGERTISLTESLTEDGLKVTASDDYSTVKITAKDNMPLTITLPNGKVLTVSVKGNIYEYTLDGAGGTYIPDVSYTGYYAAYSREFTADTETDFSAETESVSFKTAGADASTIDVSLTHTPLTKTESVWTDTNGNGVKDEGEESSVTKGILDKEAKQVYGHEAVFTVRNALGENAIAGDIIRTSGKTIATESVTDPDGKITMAEGQIISLTDKSGCNISVLLDTDGRIKLEAMAALSGKIEEAAYPAVKLNGSDDSTSLELVRSVSLARQDRAARSLQIKINSVDDLNVSPIKNEHLKVDRPSYTPGGSTYRFELTKNDIETGETLEGAVFELYASHEDENGKLVRDDVPLYKDLVTDKEGCVKVTLSVAGTYYYRETKAPAGYICDGQYYKFDVGIDGKVVATVTMVNERQEQEAVEKPSKEPEKPNRPQKPHKVPKTGDESDLTLYLALCIIFAVLSIFSAVKKGGRIWQEEHTASKRQPKL